MARVQHPNLATDFDVGRVDNGVFVAVEYVRGAPLREWLDDGERSRREVLRAFIQAARGLHVGRMIEPRRGRP